MRKRIGFVFSGAASRIAQELVLMRYLVEGLVEAPRGVGSFSWDDYETLIRGLKNQDVYEAGGIIPEALQIIQRGAILDTRPLRELLEDTIVSRAGFRLLGDLPLKTYLSVVDRDTGRVCRLCSRDNPDLPLVQVLMASTAIPIAFPSQKLKLPGSERPVPCIDGGTGMDGIPVDALRNERCHTIYVIRPMRYDPAKSWNKDMPLSRFQIMANALNTFMYVQEALLNNALFRATRYARSRAHVYAPVLPHNHNLLDFESGGEQIGETIAWAERGDSAPELISDLPRF